MNILLKGLCITLGLSFFSTAMAYGTTTEANAVESGPLMVFQVIQSQLTLNAAMIESATIIEPANSTDSYGLQIKLSSSAATELKRLSGENIGKRMNLVLGDVVVSSPIIRSSLGAEFQMSGLTKEQAQRFLSQSHK
ncbi:SecDF P1 head subdomain-containing protein [Legionella shakespearei]|uniref:SecDF P1 head subdomain domain-containing protein n=1 Tax=Legionella shakespearei DSM 23087 TaxID=1122169 RepID=A0A0W0YWB2_9GAMM|nr:hypothetical protein [Legionella shakespearei]KTD60926.1 putative protein-export membrane protein secD [Legionella shakespearei DSM 23087]